MERTAPFVLVRPTSLAEAAVVLAANSDSRILAGGTDLLPNLRDGLGAPSKLVDLCAIRGLDTIDVTVDAITIGAGVTIARLASDTRLRGELPVLAEAAETIAGPAHRTVATVGGNLCLDTRCVYYNQSEWWRRANEYCLKHRGQTCHVAPQGTHCHAAFCGDLAPALLVLGAEVDIVGPQGTRRIPLSGLYADNGAAHLTLAAGELLSAVHVPRQPAHTPSGYRKARARAAIDFPLAGVAVRITMQGATVAELRVALTGTNSRPFLLEGTSALAGGPLDEAALAKLAKLVQKQASPMRTTVTQADYRRQVAATLAQRLARLLAASIF